MDDDQLLRYSRQLLLPQIDSSGQQKLLDATILIIGAGGLGCPAAMYLAAAGVGKLIIADHDKVELSNLQRQIAHHTEDIGLTKTESLRQSLSALNPACNVITANEQIEKKQLDTLVPQADVVLDCSDNFATRFAVNEACVSRRKPLVSGAAIRFEGQLMVYDPAETDCPCYQCLYPEQGETEESCSENGVVAPLVGIIGSMQALEAIKLLTSAGETTCGQLHIFNGLTLEWRSINLTVNKQCPTCQTSQ